VKNKTKRLFRKWVPPGLLQMIGDRRNITWSGDFGSWVEAIEASRGYEDPCILCRVKEAALKVKSGEAAYERDSVLFHEKDYRWPVLAILLKVAARNENRLRVLDVGGSLGSSYYQHREFLNDLSEIRWSIVEQKAFVSCGKSYFETEELRFFEDLDSGFAQNPIELVLLSSVLPYVENPYDLLGKIFSYEIPHIIMDRTPFLLTGNRDRLTVQKIPPTIYPASYPAWFFNKKKFFRFVEQKYRIAAIFDSEDEANIPCEYKGLFLEKLDIAS
jgi:putative methyltransferase (TIGR04325 family)